MHSVALIGLLCASAVRAANGVNPTAPGPGQSFNEGADCPIQWDLDTTGKWTSFSIDLMSGSNTGMTPVTNVASGLDGTKGETSHTWKCPKVTPNSAIYFYQFSQAGADTAWTTRFTIASASGASTPPANTAQPDGKNIPWGTGHLAGAAAPTSTSTASTTPAANTPLTTTTTPTTNSSTSTTTTGSTSEATPATNSTTNSTLPTGSTSTATPSTGASTSTVTGTAASSAVTPKLSQSPSTAGQSGSRGSTTSGSTTTPTSGASSLLPASFTLFAMVLVTMLFFSA